MHFVVDRYVWHVCVYVCSRALSKEKVWRFNERKKATKIIKETSVINVNMMWWISEATVDMVLVRQNEIDLWWRREVYMHQIYSNR